MLTDEMIEDAGLADCDFDAVKTYFDNGDTLDGFEDVYLGCYPGNNADDAVGDWLWEIEAVDLSSLPEDVRFYFDWEKWGRDMQMSGDIWVGKSDKKDNLSKDTYFIFSNR